MEATLTTPEMETIARMVSEKIYAKFIADESQKVLQKKCEEYTKQMVQYYVTDNGVSHDVRKMIAPIFDEHIKSSKLVEEHLNTYMHTDHFKKLELKHLEYRVSQIRRELEYENE